MSRHKPSSAIFHIKAGNKVCALTTLFPNLAIMIPFCWKLSNLLLYNTICEWSIVSICASHLWQWDVGEVPPDTGILWLFVAIDLSGPKLPINTWDVAEVEAAGVLTTWLLPSWIYRPHGFACCFPKQFISRKLCACVVSFESRYKCVLKLKNVSSISLTWQI